MDWLSGQLGEADWFSGDAFGWGDLSVAPYLNGISGFGYTPEKGSALETWLVRVNARDSVREAAGQARASIAGMQAVSAAVEAGIFRRHYRDHRLEWMIRSGGMEIVRDGIERNTIRFTDHWDN
jgi:glutathione S-transferase/RNA polymerase-associated protein